MGHGLFKFGLLLSIVLKSGGAAAQVLEPVEFQSEFDGQRLGVIRSILSTEHGLWVGGENGLFHKQGDGVAKVTSGKRSFGYVSDIDILNKEHLLISVFGEGLFVINKNSKVVSPLMPAPNNKLDSVWQVDVSEKYIVVSTVSNILLLDRESLDLVADFRDEGITEGHKIHRLAFSTDGNSLWWVEKNRGLYHLDMQTRRWTHIPLANFASEDLEITSILPADKDVLVGTVSGIYRLSQGGEVIEKYFRPHEGAQTELNRTSFHYLARDTKGNVWAAAETLYVLSNETKKLLKPRHLFPYLSTDAVQLISNIEFDRNSNIIIVDTQRGLGVIPSHSVSTSYLEINGEIFDSHVNSMASTAPDQIFLSSDSSLYFFNFRDRESKKFDIDTESDLKILSAIGVNAKVIDESGNVFIVNAVDGTVEKLNELPNMTGRRIIDAKSFPERGHFYITQGVSGEAVHFETEQRSIVKDFAGASVIGKLRQNRVLIGVDGDGIYEWTKSNSIEKLLIPHDFALQNIICMYQADDGILWICTSGGGLLGFNLETNEVTKLPYYRDLHIRGVTELSSNFLLVTSNNGLSLLDLYARKQIKVGKLFGITDSDFEYQGIINTGESVIIVGDNQNYRLDTDIFLSEIDNLKHRKTGASITGFRTFNDERKMLDSINGRLFKALESASLLELTNDEFLFDIDVSGTDLIEDENFTLQYRLKGLSDEWIDAREKRATLTFTTLDVGSYELQARVSSDMLNVPPEIAKLGISVPPPIWFQWPALLFYSVLIIAMYPLKDKDFRAKLGIGRGMLSLGLKQRENQLNETMSAMREYVERKQKMFSDISHEMKSPVMLIRGPLQDIRANPKDDKANKKRIEIALNQADKLQYLVNQIIQIEQLESVTKLPRKPVQVKECIEGLGIQMQALTDFKSQILDVSINGDAVLILIEDSLEKMVINLVTNASKYSDAKTMIKVRVRVDEETVTVRVVDEGVGICEKDFESVFQRFNQLKTTTEEGSGIGLAMVRELARANGGEVEVKSKEGEGSTFTITLPVTCPEAAACAEVEWVPVADGVVNDIEQEQELLPPVEADKPLVLIVDDNRDMRFYLCDIFEPFYTCVTARNGQHAIDVLQVCQPDLIVSDLEMPELDGVGLAKHVKHTDSHNLIPFIMLTAHEDKELRSSAWEQEIDDYISKPFNSDELLVKVRNILNNRSKISEFIEQQQEKDLRKTSKDIPQFSSRKDMEFYTNFLAVIEKNYQNEKWGRADAAGLLLISERQLNRKVSELFGSSFTEYLRNHRLNKAGVRLASGEQITNVAYGVGFGTPSYFSSCFKQKFGKSPKGYQDDAIEKSPVTE